MHTQFPETCLHTHLGQRRHIHLGTWQVGLEDARTLFRLQLVALDKWREKGKRNIVCVATVCIVSNKSIVEHIKQQATQVRCDD